MGGKNLKKNIINIFTFLLIITSTLATSANINKNFERNIDTNNFNTSRVILVEYLTLSTDPLTDTTSNQLYYLFATQKYNFIYITMVGDKNEFARKRIQELDITDFPVVVFDSGFKYVYGKQDSSQAYENAVLECSTRKTPNIFIDLEASWTTSPCFPEIIINVLVGTTKEEVYNGRLLISVIKITSDFEDQNGRPFDYSLEDHAFDQDINVKFGPFGKFEIELIYFPNSPGCYRFNAFNYLIIATFFSNDSKYADATAYARIVPGEQPMQPIRPIGDTSGRVGENLVYKTSSVDPDGHQIKYGWDWNGNFKVDEWTKLHDSNEQVEINHIWRDQGIHTIRVKAKDEKGFESFWSHPLPITISKRKHFDKLFSNPMYYQNLISILKQILDV